MEYHFDEDTDYEYGETSIKGLEINSLSLNWMIDLNSVRVSDWTKEALNLIKKTFDDKQLFLFKEVSSNILSISDKLLDSAFGDHSIVKISSNGNISVEEYDHE